MSKEKTFYESVHLLRGFSAFIVLLGHNFGWYKLPGIDPIFDAVEQACTLGQVGVTIFFVISGFVLPLSLIKFYALIDFPRFLSKRLIRIEPAYLVSIGISVGILLLKTRVAPNATPYPFELNQFFSHLLYLIPFTGFDWYNEVYWTLAIEFQFYLLIAIIFPLWNKSSGMGIVLACLFSCLYFLSELVPQVGLFSKAPLFSVGMLSLSALKMNRPIQKILILVLVGLMLLVYGFATKHADLSVAAIVTFAVIVWWNAPRVRLRYLGTISYSLYITHYPVIFLTNQTARHFWGTDGHPMLYITAFGNIAIALIIAHFMYQFIEKPTQRLSKKIRYRGEMQNKALETTATSAASQL